MIIPKRKQKHKYIIMNLRNILIFPFGFVIMIQYNASKHLINIQKNLNWNIKIKVITKIINNEILYLIIS